LDIANLEKAGAVLFHDFEDDDSNNKMLWPSNYTKLACATMFTVFFGGDEFAPERKYRGESCQQYLQRHYFACYRYLASYSS
jgi:hypothetical protein